MNPQRRGSNRSNIPSSAAHLSKATNTSQPQSMPSYSTFSPDLKWHNTLPEDFNGRSKSANSDRSIKKRPSGTFENIDAILQSHVHHTVTSPNHLSPVPPTHTLNSSPLPSPIKRPRALPTQPAKTPTKSRSSASITSSGSGMQTPPPSSRTTARKRGRPSKKFYSESASNNSPRTEASPTKKVYTGGHQKKFEPQHPDSGVAMSTLDEVPAARFFSKSDDSIWDGGLAYIAELGGNSHELGHSASVDWSSIRNNASTDNLASLTEIFGPPPSARRRPSQSSLTDEVSDNPTFSFLEFDDPYGLEMPLDVNPNLLFSSTTNSAASSLIGGRSDEYKPFTFVQQPYQHQHLQHLREKELEVRRQRQLQEKLSKERLGRERTVAASGGRNGSRHPSVLNHSRSDGFLHAPQDTRAANFNAAAVKRCSSNISRSESERPTTPEPPRQRAPIQSAPGQSAPRQSVPRQSVPRQSVPRQSAPHSALRRTTERIPSKMRKTRTEVVLAISPGGRAKTETMVVYDSSDTETEKPAPGGWDSLEESDSSFDDDVPRGLGPDGIDYTLYRQRKILDPFQDTRPTPQRLMVPSHESSAEPPPRTPTRRTPLKMPMSRRSANGFAATTAAAATSVSGRIDSSPRLPTPLKSSPPSVFDSRLGERVRRATRSSLTPSRSVGTPRLGPMQEVSDESEAETVVDGTEIGVLDEEEDGDALHALKRIMMARRINEACKAASIESTPTRSRPGSAVKQQQPLSMHPAFLRPSPAKKKLFEEQILRSVSRQRTAADGGYLARRTATRCVCGGDDSGTLMVQWNWLHLRCVGRGRKSLRAFECAFCMVGGR